MGSNIPSRIVGRAAESSCAQANLCEKPVSTSSLTIPIALGVWYVLRELFEGNTNSHLAAFLWLGQLSFCFTSIGAMSRS